MQIETKYDSLVAAIKFVRAEIAKRLDRSIDRLPEVAEQFAELAKVAAVVRKNTATVEDMGPVFTGGVKAVLDAMSAFLSGYSSNGQDIVMVADLEKSAESIDSAVAAFGERFPAIVESKSDAESDAKALGDLRALYKMLLTVVEKTLNWEASSGKNPPIHKDPFQTTPTTAGGSIEALSAAASGPASVLKSDDPARVALAKAAAAVDKANAGDVTDWPMDLNRPNRK